MHPTCNGEKAGAIPVGGSECESNWALIINNMKRIILFDMDGTLTPARKPMEIDILDALRKLNQADFEIGIVTGSDFDYLQEQCHLLFNSSLRNQIHYLPCNGTKYYRLDIQSTPLSQINMIQKLGQKRYNQLLAITVQAQLNLINQYPLLSFTGNFFHYRGSMLNWCPIGRAAGSHERALWERLDHDNKIRLPLLEQARREYSKTGLDSLTINLGGETSFDIYPIGWDKTYALKYFRDHQIYFIGDRCQPNGNDHHIYEACKPYSWETRGPEETIKIIQGCL